MINQLHVVAAVLHDKHQRFLVQQRQSGKHMAGFWEFPGGKLELGETSWIALQRELLEELNITPVHGAPLVTLEHAYPDRHIKLEVWLVDNWDGQVEAQEAQVIEWCSLSKLYDVKLLPADAPVLTALAIKCKEKQS